MTVIQPALADFLDQRRERITAEWLQRVRRDRAIPSADDLPRTELIDHVPFLLNALIARLRGTPHAGPETDHQSQVHGETRAEQNYELPELLREVSILRHVLIEAWVEFDDEAGTDRRAQLESSVILHTILDEVIAESTAGFVARQQDEILAANARLAELDERRLRTLRTITHEIANHLNAAGLLIALLKRAPLAPDAPQSIDALARGITTMTGLMQQLLEFSMLVSAEERPSPFTIELRTLFEELSSVGRSLAAEKKLTFAADLDPALGPVVSDPGILRRIALNLLSNAVKYTPAGNVRIAFRAVDQATWCLEVVDTGCGILPGERSAIFEEFYRGQVPFEVTPGVGLGLAITRQLAALLNGRVEVDSAVGLGSTFRVIMPRY